MIAPVNKNLVTYEVQYTRFFGDDSDEENCSSIEVIETDHIIEGGHGLVLFREGAIALYVPYGKLIRIRRMD